MAETETVYVTKSALSQGIKSRPVVDVGGGYMRDAEGWNVYSRTQWTRDRAVAVDRAERMRATRIASLRKQIAKLEKLSFGETP